MKRQQLNQLKALFLLLVFSLNTMVGFACSVGVNMGYNAHHHEHRNSHVHKADKKQHKHKQRHHQQHQHRHQPATSKVSIKGVNDDCCANSVANFTLLNKAVADNRLKLQAPVFLLAFTTAFSSQIINDTGVAVNSRFQFVRRRPFLNDTDLRIAIQSFLI